MTDLRPLQMAALVACAAAPVSASAQTLRERVDSQLENPVTAHALWGIAAADLDGTVRYTHNADQLFVPASNTKLVVAITAATLLPADFTVVTSVYGTGPIVHDTLAGDLVLYGRGDPTFSHRCYAVDTTAAGVCQHDPAAALQRLAGQLRDRGIRVVAGALVGDGSYFEATEVHPAWENYDLGWWYAAPVSGLGFNDNSLDVHELPGAAVGAAPVVTFSPDAGSFALDNRAVTGPAGAERTFDLFRSAAGYHYTAVGVLPLGAAERTEYAAVTDPDRYTALAFRNALRDSGIAVLGPVRSTTDSFSYAAARRTAPLAEVPSRPLADWLFAILNRSQNWFAEMLLKQLGRQCGDGGSWRAGLAVERRFLIDSVAIDSTEFSLQDGSGLASENLMTPRALVRLLTFARHRPAFALLARALPRAGEPGSLSHRFVGTPLAGRVLAKTGTIDAVNALSGYIERADGTVEVFAVLANNHNLASARVTAAIDSLVVRLAGH
jgi:serine-type D-Ala-D-Ala carboxypeptidase/endopeptidase (penicillin-binding protein 4)